MSSLKSLSKVLSAQRAMADSLRPTLAIGTVQRAVADSLRPTLAIGTVQRAVADSLRPTLAIGTVQRAVADSLRPTLAVGMVQRAVADSLRPTLAVGMVQRAVADSLRPTLAIGMFQRAMADSLRPTLAFGVVQRAIAESTYPVTQLTSRWSHIVFEKLAPFRISGRFHRSGWFPHNTFPTHLLAHDNDDALTDKAVLRYYSANWAMVRRVIERELSLCHVDDEAKQTLRQALIAHEEGLYRLVPSSLFPMIERAVRVCLFGDRLGTTSMMNQLAIKLGELPVTALPYGALGFVGYSQLSHHLYENIYTDSAREHFLLAPVPNRHATIHGLVAYNSEKSSLNAIFIAMYMFRALSVLQFRQIQVPRCQYSSSCSFGIADLRLRIYLV